jgi:hypothetical protein
MALLFYTLLPSILVFQIPCHECKSLLIIGVQYLEHVLLGYREEKRLQKHEFDESLSTMSQEMKSTYDDKRTPG